MNKVILTGYVANDIELKTTQSGTPVVSFNVAARRPRTKDDTTDFLTVVAWRHTAEFISKYFQKGSGIEVSGIITVRKWQDKDGNNRYSTEIVAEEVDFGKKQKGDGGRGGSETSYQAPQQGGFNEIAEDDEDLPF